MLFGNSLGRHTEMFYKSSAEIAGMAVTNPICGDTHLAACRFQHPIGIIHPDFQQQTVRRVVKKMVE